MVDYVGNSKKNKEEPPDKTTVVKKVVTGKVVEKKPGIGKKMKGIFFGAEFRNVGDYLVQEVLLPAFRNLIVDTVQKGVDRAIYGEPAYGPRRGRPEYRSRTTYNTPVNRVYDTTARERAHIPDQPMRPRTRRGGLEFLIQSRAEAESALEQMSAVIEQFDVLSIAEAKEILGLKAEYTDRAWGWTVLVDVEISQTRDGYLLDLPPAEAL